MKVLEMQSRTHLALSIDDLTVAYHEKPAIWDIDLDVPAGVLMGDRRSQWRRQKHLD